MPMCLKHTVLIATLQYLTEKDAALTVLDTTPARASTGWMATTPAPAQKPPDGILRLVAPPVPPSHRLWQRM